MTDTDSLTARQAKDQILAIVKRIPTQDLPKFKERDGCLWFEDLGMGWVSSSDPARLAQGWISMLFAAEAAGRELLRRIPVDSVSA